jgi:hypothetical protein
MLATFFVSSFARGFPSRIHQLPLRQSRLKNQSLVDEATSFGAKSLHGFALLPQSDGRSTKVPIRRSRSRILGISQLSTPRLSPWPLHRGWLRRRSGRRGKDPRYLQIGRNVRLQGVGLDAEPHCPTRRVSQDDRPILLLVLHQATVALISARHGC